MRNLVQGIQTTQMGVGIMKPLGSGGIQQPGGVFFKSLAGSALGGLDPTGIVSGLATQLLGKVLESKVNRNNRLVQQVLEQAKNDSNVSAGTLEGYNEYLKQLSRWYVYQVKIKGRSQGSEIQNVINQVSTALSQNGYKKVKTATATQQRSKGNFDYSYPVFGVDSFFASTQGVKSSVSQKGAMATKQTFTGQPVNQNSPNTDESEKPFNPLWLLLLIPISLGVMFFKSIKKIL